MLTRNLAFLIYWWSFLSSFLSCCQSRDVEVVVDMSNVIVVAITQPHEYHAEKASDFMRYIHEQVPPGFQGAVPVVELSHEAWPGMLGVWTITPILKSIWTRYGERDWVLFCTEGTRLELHNLYEVLMAYNPAKPLLLGRALRDSDATIIHHFAFHENPSAFSYPDLSAGFVMSMALISQLVTRLEKDELKSDFSIDAIHELAMFIRDDGAGLLMTSDDAFCAGDEHDQCATSFPQHAPQCGQPISEDDVFIAVKTCTQFHKDRVPIVQATWGKDARHLVFYSDVADAEIPTEDTGVPNTERGHCAKMMAIFERFHTEAKLSTFNWLVIADDDTMLSIKRLRLLLACYNPDEAVALGERYGYKVRASYGYDYLTGGAGMVLSRPTVQRIIGKCSCGAADAPDDMMLGICLKQLGIPVTHSPLFHQARPMDYAAGLLQHQRPISFHKHWMLEPISVYNEWFKAEPAQPGKNKHQEL